MTADEHWEAARKKRFAKAMKWCLVVRRPARAQRISPFSRANMARVVEDAALR